MMAWVPVVEPDYTLVSDFVTSSDKFVETVDNTLFSHTLSSIVANDSLGDTNVAVPGRILGHTEAYVEAGASDYILETVRYGYKLFFIDDVPPPKDFRPYNKSALSKPTFFGKSWYCLKVWVVQSELILGLPL